MKYRNIIPVAAFAAMCFASCDDQKMEWYKDPTHGEITSSELPLQLAEKISRYKALNEYTNFVLGAGIGLDLYMNDEAYRNLVNENFDEITVGYAMKHGPMVNAKGELNFTKVDEMMAKLKEAGLTVYGHTLVWHTNQNASYLNGLIAPEVIPAPAGENLVDISGLEDGTFSGGWNPQNKGDGITVKEGAGLNNGKGIELKAKSTSSAEYNLQLISPEVTFVNGHNYEISFWIKSDVAGKGRLSFEGLANNYPYMDWFGTGEATELFLTTSSWQQVKVKVNAFKEGATKFKFALDLGKVPSVTYYVDVTSISVTDLDAAPTVVNLISNGTFDAGITGWAKYNGADGCNTAATGSEAYQGGGALKVVNANNNDGGEWKTQIHADFTESLAKDQVYTVSYFIRSDVPGSARCSTSGNAKYQGGQATTTTWTQITWELTGTGAETGLNFDLGLKAATYYIDNVVVTPKQAAVKSKVRAAGPTIVEKTDEEKAEIIGTALESWISQMVGHYKADIKAWDVVNEPMDDGKPSELKTGKNKAAEDFASDEFYWQDYLGKDYAVKAFNLARQYGNPTDKLFINDYNLEYNLNKCDGLIEYVKYIESKGAKVDGIGTQMHVAINSNKDNIAQMFQKLAATGKLIKVSELDIKVNTASPTAEQFAQQSEMYQYIIDMYMKYIPEAQRYGITAWGISDNPEEHVNWIPDDAPNLWDASYARKHAYKGFADGLAGKDVSADFTGDLEY